MRYFEQGIRTVDDAGAVQVIGSYYAAAPAALYSEVPCVSTRMKWRSWRATAPRCADIRDRRRKGHYEIPEADRIFNPSRETARILGQVQKIGPNSRALAGELFARLGRPGQKALYGLRTCRATIAARRSRRPAPGCCSQGAPRIKASNAEHRAGGDQTQTDPAIRPIDDYQRFWEAHSQRHQEEYYDADVDTRT